MLGDGINKCISQINNIATKLLQTICLNHPIITAIPMEGEMTATPDTATSVSNNILKIELLLGNQNISSQYGIKSQMTV